MSIRVSLLTVAASLCMLPHGLQGDSVFNFDSDPVASHPSIGFVDVNNGIAAAFYPGAGGLQVSPASSYGYFDTIPLQTLSGNVLESDPTRDFATAQVVTNPSFSIAFSSELTSVEFNYALPQNAYVVGPHQLLIPVTVNAYSNGIFVGSETTTASLPPYSGMNEPNDEEEEGIGGFIGGPFNEVTITDTYPIPQPVDGYSGYYPYLLADNIDVSAAPEPLGLTAFGLSLMAASIVYRRRRRSWSKHCALALTVICGGLFSATAKASNITTVGFDFSGFFNGDTFTGLTVEGEGVFSFPAGVTVVNTADVTNFAYSEYLNFDNCYTPNCYVGVVDGVGVKAPNILESFTLNYLDATLNASGNVTGLGTTATGAVPVYAQFISFYPGAPGILYFDAFAGFDGLTLSGTVDIVDVTTTPEPAFIGLFAGGLVLAGLVVRSRSRH